MSDSASAQEGPACPVEDDFYLGSVPGSIRCRPVAAASGVRRKGNVVLVHGGTHTAECPVATPDGRAGWARHFADSGLDVYPVDWIETGRSYDRYDQTPGQVIESLIQLIKTAERTAECLDAVILLAPASVEFQNPAPSVAVLDELVTILSDVAIGQVRISAGSREATDNYLASLVPYGPVMRNAAIGVTLDVRIANPDRVSVWCSVPTLSLSPRANGSVPAESASAAAWAMKILPVWLGREWGLGAYAHLPTVCSRGWRISRTRCVPALRVVTRGHRTGRDNPVMCMAVGRRVATGRRRRSGVPVGAECFRPRRAPARQVRGATGSTVRPQVAFVTTAAAPYQATSAVTIPM